jgi:hypothetical protein
VSVKEFLHHNKRSRDKNLPAGKLTLAALGDDNKVTARLSVSQHLVHRHLCASEKFRGGDTADGRRKTFERQVAGPSYSYYQCSELSNFVNVKVPNFNIPNKKIPILEHF